MNLIYNTEEHCNPCLNTIFLAGPSHRESGKHSWRNDALQVLESIGFVGNVIIPEPRDGQFTDFSKSKQIEWERKYLSIANVILFWIPRSSELPGFTTNLEFGEWLSSGKVHVGCPPTAQKMDYIRFQCQEYGIPVHDSLSSLIVGIRNTLCRNPKTFFTSDTHFGSERTFEFSRRPFPSVDVMNQKLVSNWNSVVYSNDTVYHLGDFGNVDAMKYLCFGNMKLLQGNHDTDFKTQLDMKFNFGNRVTYIQNNHKLDTGITLLHKPEFGVDTDTFYLYGHIHQLGMVKRNGLNVGTDCHKFKPIDMSIVEFYRKAITQYYDANVFMEEIGG